MKNCKEMKQLVTFDHQLSRKARQLLLACYLNSYTAIILIKMIDNNKKSTGFYNSCFLDKILKKTFFFSTAVYVIGGSAYYKPMFSSKLYIYF